MPAFNKALIIRRPEKDKSAVVGITDLCQRDVSQSRTDKLTPRKTRGVDLLIRYGCREEVGFNGVAVLNSIEALRLVAHKSEFRRVCQDHSRDLVPATHFEIDYVANSVRDGRPTTLRVTSFDTGDAFPCIVRPATHSKGENLFVVNNNDELDAAVRRAGRGYYVSKLINKTAEYRVFVVQGRAICVYNKIPDDPAQVAWNVSQGGRFENVRWDEWPLQAVRKSIEAFNLSGLDFGAVDVMVGDDRTAYVIEINSAPALQYNSDGTPCHRMTMMARCIDWIMENGKERIAVPEAKGGYLKFIHPAVCDRARL